MIIKENITKKINGQLEGTLQKGHYDFSNNRN